MGSEYNTTAQSTKLHWERSLSYQSSLSLQLQENFEALAKQMHGLENEARRASIQGMDLQPDLDASYQFPNNNSEQSLNSAYSTTSSSVTASSPKFTGSTKVPGSVQRLNRPNTKKEVSFKIPSSPSPEPTGPTVLVTDNRGQTSSPDDIEEDDDQFFDAEEGSHDVPDSDNLLGSKKSLHKRTESSISMNEPQRGSFVPDSIPPENLPGGTTSDTVTVCCLPF